MYYFSWCKLNKYKNVKIIWRYWDINFKNMIVFINSLVKFFWDKWNIERFRIKILIDNIYMKFKIKWFILFYNIFC